MARVDGLALGMLGAGSLFAYAGVKGYSIPHAIQSIVQGQPPTVKANPITTPTGGSLYTGPGGGGVGGLAAKFLTYAGKVPYVWGGAKPTGWDCSGSCNYVICHDAGHDIPEFKGGSFDGSEHGPSTYAWLPWVRSNMTRLTEAQAGTDDLVLWISHMGVVTRMEHDGLHYISAYDTAEGTVEKPVHGGGPWGEVATFWRFR